MIKWGLKLWASNLHYIKPAVDLYHKGVFQYIELFIDSDNNGNYADHWKTLGIPYHLHAPHSYSGLNLSVCAKEKENLKIVEKVDQYRKYLNPEKIIFHPGIEGEIHETIRQLQCIQRKYADLFAISVIENKPRLGVKGEHCVGSSPNEIKQILEALPMGFCLDVGHAMCYAAWSKEKWQDVLNKFLNLSPSVYHLSDGDVNSQIDQHLHLGKGNYDLKKIIRMIPLDTYVAVETDKDSKTDLNDFAEDANYIKGFLYENSKSR